MSNTERNAPFHLKYTSNTESLCISSHPCFETSCLIPYFAQVKCGINFRHWFFWREASRVGCHCSNDPQNLFFHSAFDICQGHKIQWILAFHASNTNSHFFYSVFDMCRTRNFQSFLSLPASNTNPHSNVPPMTLLGVRICPASVFRNSQMRIPLFLKKSRSFSPVFAIKLETDFMNC